MKQRDFSPCLICKKGVMHSGSLVFYRVKIEIFGIKLAEVEKQVGLELMLGRQAALAQALGPDNDLAECVSTILGLVCLDCFINTRAAEFLGAQDHD